MFFILLIFLGVKYGCEIFIYRKINIKVINYFYFYKGIKDLVIICDMCMNLDIVVIKLRCEY